MTGYNFPAAPAEDACFRVIFNHCLQFIGLLALDGTLLAANARALAFIGATEADVIGRPFWETPWWTHDHQAQQQLRDAIVAAAAGEFVRFEVEYQGTRGRRVSFDFSVSPVRDDAGQVAYLIPEGRDISVRKQVESERDALLRLEHAARAASDEAAKRWQFLARVSAVLSSSLDYESTLQTVAQLAVPVIADWCVVDLLEESGRIVRVAVAGAEPELRHLQTRVEAEPTTSEGVAEVIRTGKRQCIRVVTDAFLHAGGVLDERYRVSRAVGARSILIVPLSARGWTFGALALIRTDATKPFEEADELFAEELASRAALAVDNARLYREATVALRLRDELVGTVIHDLRQPLTTMRGYTQLLQRRVQRLAEAVRDPLTEGLESISQASATMLEMVNELVDEARLQAGHALELRYADLDLVQLAYRQAAAYAKTSERHTIHVEPPVEAIVGTWDEARLARVVSNLLSNAIKYSPKGGDIRITIHVEQEGTGTWAVLRVRDEGIGIPTADLPRVFERFHRASNVRGQIPGTGIGLSGARQIVDQHGGTLTVTSTEGVGTTVEIRLPYGWTQNQPAPALPTG